MNGSNEKLLQYLIELVITKNQQYNAYIGYIFVDEKYRGNRLSQKMIQYLMNYLKSIGFDRVHIVSDHDHLYEKYGFEIVDRKISPWGSVEKIYIHKIL